MKPPVWVVKLATRANRVAVDAYYAWPLWCGWFATSQRSAYRFRLRADAERRAAAFPGSRVVRLVPRGGK